MKRKLPLSVILLMFTLLPNSLAASKKRHEVVTHSILSDSGVRAAVRIVVPPRQDSSMRTGMSIPRPSSGVARKFSLPNSTPSLRAPEFPSVVGSSICSSAGGVVRFSVVGGVDCHARVTPTRDRPDNERRRRRRAPKVSPEQLASIAYDRARSLAPEARLEVTPNGVGLTGLPSYFHLDSPPQPITATASAGGVTVTAAAQPVQYVWDFGDGRNSVTTHSGRPWSRKRPGNVDHLYERVGRYELAVEVIWQAQWRVNGGPWQPLGYFSTSDSRSYPVHQVRSALVRRR